MNPRTSITLHWLAVAAWAGLIFRASAESSLESGLPGGWDWVLRKLAHITVYAVLTALLYCAFAHAHRADPHHAGRLAGVLALLYAFSDELHQWFVPGRNGRLHDVAIDALGIALALWLAWRQHRRATQA